MGLLGNLFRKKGGVAAYRRDIHMLEEDIRRLFDEDLSTREAMKIVDHMAEKWKSLEKLYGEDGREYQIQFIETWCADSLDMLHRHPGSLIMTGPRILSFLATLRRDGHYPEVEKLWAREEKLATQTDSER